MRFQIIALVLVSGLVGCKSKPKPDDKNHDPLINVENGVNQFEAQLLANLYFNKHIGISCGGATVVEDKITHWEIVIVIGFAGLPMKSPMIINKDTGKITLEGYPDEDAQELIQNEPVN